MAVEKEWKMEREREAREVRKMDKESYGSR
jgi:hypothetical protein